MKRRISVAVSICYLIVPVCAVAGVPFPQVPDWESADVSSISTGGALADLDKDGWLDLIVSNGNDVERQSLVVYYNRKDGTFPPLPDWSSQAAEYHGHLAVGDVNDDGWPDVAVSVFLGPAKFAEPGWVSLYLNDGAGGLPDLPSWRSSDIFYNFSVAFGDADGDGDLDLAVAVGEPYFSPADKSRIYYNEGGQLKGTPDWLCDEVEHNLGVAWGDADGDGDLDLALSGSAAPHRIYYQTAAGIAQSSGWQSAQIASLGDRVAFGDADRDGFMDLAIAENNQLGGEGRFRLFSGSSGGLSDTPSWSSDFSGYGADVVIGDANGDGWPELLGGSWGANTVFSDPVRIYPNRYVRPYDRAAGWQSATGSVIERILLGDVNNDGLRTARESLSANGVRKLFYVRAIPFRAILEIRADGRDLGYSEYCYDPEAGWISLAAPPIADLEVSYLYSTRLDMVITNWDDNQGNFLFYALEPPVLYAGPGPLREDQYLSWTGAYPDCDLLASTAKPFDTNLQVIAEKLTANDRTDSPGALPAGAVKYYRVY